MNHPLLELQNVSCSRDGCVVFKDINLTINEGTLRKVAILIPALIVRWTGDITVLRGKSGSGKTTLLKCIAHLVLYDGQVLYRGR